MSSSALFKDVRACEYELPSSISAQIMTPALVIHLDKVRENIKRVVQYVGDVMRWRPHLKTTKIPQVWAELLRAGLRRFKVATTRELAVLCEVILDEEIAGSDVLLAYPLTGPALSRLRDIAKTYPSVRISGFCLVEIIASGHIPSHHVFSYLVAAAPDPDLAVLCEDCDAVSAVPSDVGIFLDINVGMNRTGMPIREACDNLLKFIEAAEANGEGRFRGLHCYEGHLSQPDLKERTAKAHAIYDQVMELVRKAGAASHRVREVITSGTPGFKHALSYAPFTEELGSNVHQVSPGTVVFHDLTVESVNPDINLVPAAVLLSSVISHPDSSTVTLDAGSKSIAAEAGDPAAFVIGRPGWMAMKCSEEHMPVRIGKDEAAPHRGTRLSLVPRHICPTVNLAEEALLVDKSSGSYCIVPVSGRGHELALGAASVYAPVSIAVGDRQPCKEAAGQSWKRQRFMSSVE